MKFNIDQFPSIISKPYAMAQKKTTQRKDYQRFLLENTVSFLACIAVSNVIELFNELIANDSTDVEIDEIRKELLIDLKRMSLGKWNHALRDTTKLLLRHKKSQFMPELIDFYHGSSSKKVVGAINSAISTRNNDAHGNPIPEGELTKVLDARQNILENVLEGLDFFSDYKLLFLESLDMEDGKSYYLGKQFVGAEHSVVKIFSTSTLPQNEVFLYHKKSGRYLKLSPMVLFTQLDDEEEDHLAIFSKTMDKNSELAQYLSIDGHSTIDIKAFDKKNDAELNKRLTDLWYIYADPTQDDFNSVNLTGTLSFLKDSAIIDKECEMEFTLDNTMSTDLSEVVFTFELPSCLSISSWESQIPYEHISTTTNNNTYKLSFDHFLEGRKEKINFKVKPTEQGVFSSRPGIVYYQYYRTSKDQENNKYSTDDFEIESDAIEVRDPNSRDKMSPVINIRKNFNSTTSLSKIEIGNNFTFEIEINNIGLGSASNLNIELIIPEGMELVEGREIITTNINPNEVKSYKYTLISKRADIYNIIVRDLIYLGADGKKYITQVNDDFRVLVRSNLQKEFKYIVEESLEDLSISTKEKLLIDGMVTANEYLTNEMYVTYEFEGVLSRVRELVKRICQSKGLKVQEALYVENTRQTKLTSKAARTAFVFSIKDIPTFAIDITNSNNISFYSIPSRMDARAGVLNESALYTSDSDIPLTRHLDFEQVKYDTSFGQGGFSAWISMCFAKLTSNYLPAVSLAEAFKEKFTSEQVVIKKDSIHLFFSDLFCSELALVSRNRNRSNVQIIFDFNKPNSFYLIFMVNRGISKLVRDRLSTLNPSVIYLEPAAKGEKGSINSSWSTSNKPSAVPALHLSIKNTEESITDSFSKSLALINSLRKLNSIHVLSMKEFENLTHIGFMKEKVNEFVENNIGAIYRLNALSKPSIEFVNLTETVPGKVTTKEMIASASISRKSIKFSIKFFNYPVINDDKKGLISMQSRWYRGISSGDVFTLDRGKDESTEDIDFIMNLIIQSATSYKAKALAKWPEFIAEEALKQHCMNYTGISPLLECIGQEVDLISDLESEFEKNELTKELYKTLKRCIHTYPRSFGYEPIFSLAGTGSSQRIALSGNLLNGFKVLKQISPSFDFAGIGSQASIRNYLNILKNVHHGMASRTVANTYVTTKSGSLHACQSEFSIRINNTRLTAEITWPKKHVADDCFMAKLIIFFNLLKPDVKGIIESTNLEFMLEEPTITSGGVHKFSLALSHDNFNKLADEELLQDISVVFKGFFKLTEKHLDG